MYELFAFWVTKHDNDICFGWKILKLFAFSRFSKNRLATWLNPVFWVSLWTAWQLRVTCHTTYTALPNFLYFVWFVCRVVVFKLGFYCKYTIGMMNHCLQLLIGGNCMKSWMKLELWFLLGLVINKHEFCQWSMCWFYKWWCLYEHSMNLYDVCILNYVSLKVSTVFGVFGESRRVHERYART